MPHSHFIYFVVPSEEDKERMLLGVKNLDRNLGPYPFQAWSKWVSLSSRLRSHHPLLDGVISKSVAEPVDTGFFLFEVEAEF